MIITMMMRRRRRRHRRSGSRVHDRIHHRIRRRRTRHPMTDARRLTPYIHPSIRPFGYPPTSKTSKKNAKNETPKRRPVFRPVPETLMTIHDSSFNTYTYIHVCILPIWDTRGVSYECLVRIVQRRTARSGRVFCSSGGRGRRDEGGVASRLAPGGVGSVRSVSIGSDRFLSDRFSGV